MSILENLIGLKVVKIIYNNNLTISLNKIDEILFESPISIIFEDYTLNIYNPFTIKGIEIELSLKVLENLRLIAVKEQSNEISLMMGIVELIIDLRNESYKGPEALSLYGPNNLIVAWN